MFWSLFKQYKNLVRLALLWLVLTAFIGLIYFIVALPVRIKISRLQARITVKNKEVRRMVEYVSEENLDHLKKLHEDLRHRLGTFVSNADMVNDSICEISRIAEQVGVRDFKTRQKSFDGFEPVANCQLLSAANVQVECRGTYFQFLKLVNAYERFRPIILIDRFSFHNDGGKFLVIKMTLTILVNNSSGNLI